MYKKKWETKKKERKNDIRVKCIKFLLLVAFAKNVNTKMVSLAVLLFTIQEMSHSVILWTLKFKFILHINHRTCYVRKLIDSLIEVGVAEKENQTL